MRRTNAITAPLNYLAKWFLKHFAHGGGRKRRPYLKRQQPRTRLGMDLLLEDRIVPAVLAQNDFAATLPNASVMVAVLANDTGTQLAVIYVTPPANGMLGINADNSVTFTPNAGASGLQTVEVTVSDGTTQATSSLALYVASSAYDAYLWKVAQADQQYQDTVLGAAASRHGTIETARSDALAAAAQVEAVYQATVAQAQQDYDAIVTPLGTTFHDTVQNLNHAQFAAATQAWNTYQTALANAQTAHDQAIGAADQIYQQALSVAQENYDATVNPYLGALAEASAIDQANQTAYAETQTTLAATTLAAGAARDQALAEAQATLAGHEQEYASALDAADSTYATTLAPIQAARDAAWDNYQANTSDATAQAAYDDAEAILAQTIATAGGIRDATQLTALTAWQTAQTAATAAVQSADADYATTVVPAQAACAAAWADCEASQSAIAIAQSALQEAMSSAGELRDAAQAVALATFQIAEQIADETLTIAQAVALEEYEASAQNGAQESFDYAHALFLAQETLAQSIAVARAAGALNIAQHALDQIQANLSAQEAEAHAQYAVVLAAALTTWQGLELGDWTSYQTALATAPEATASEARVLAPAEVAVAPETSNSGIVVTRDWTLLGIIVVVVIVVIVVAVVVGVGFYLWNVCQRQLNLNPAPVPPPFPAAGAAPVTVQVPPGGNPSYIIFPTSRPAQLAARPLAVIPIRAASLVLDAPGTPGLIGGLNGVQGFTSRFISPGGLVRWQYAGTGGCQPSIGLIITSPTMGTAIFHFGGTNGDIAATLSQYTWPDDAHAAICGGDNEHGSNCNLETVVNTLVALGITNYGIADTGNIWIGSNGRWYYDDRAPSNDLLPGQLPRLPIIAEEPEE